MPNQELLKFINAQLANGLDKQSITNDLLLKGWQQNQIDEAFAATASPTPIPTTLDLPTEPQPQTPPPTLLSQHTYVQPQEANPTTTPKESNKKKTAIILLLILFILTSLSFGFVSAFAYGLLPIKNYELQNKIADIIMQIPFMPKTPRFVLESSANAHLKVTKASFNISLAVDSNSLNTVLGTSKLDALVTGKVDYADIKKPLVDLNLKVTKDFDFDFKFKDQLAYFRVKSIPAMLAVLLNNFGFTEKIQQQLLNKWLYVDTKPMETDARKNLDNNTDNKTIINEQTKNYLDAFNNPDVLNSLTMKDEKLDNVNTYHIHFAPNDKVLNIFWDKYTQSVNNKSTTTTQTTDAKYKISDSIKNFVVDIWIDKQHYFTQKSNVRLTVKSPSYSPGISANPLGMVAGQEQEIPIAVSVRLSNFNETVNVDTPKDAVKFDDFVKELMPQMQTQTGVNSARQFSQANDTRRRSDVTQILNAIGAYAADNKGILPKNMPAKGAIAKKISSSGANICSSLVPNYIPALPQDPTINSGANLTKCTSYYDTGFKVSVDASGRVTVSAPFAELGTITITR